jgi:hypothetical protein
MVIDNSNFENTGIILAKDKNCRKKPTTSFAAGIKSVKIQMHSRIFPQ